MRNSVKKVLCLVLALALMVPCFASCGKSELNVPAFSEDTIKIGASGPLTGGAAVYGIAVKNGASLAVHEINEAGGLDGIMLSFEMYDDQHVPANVATGYANLADKNMQISLGCVTSGPCLEFVKLADDDNMFVLTPSASADDVPSANGVNNETVYQMCFADNNQGTVAAQTIKDNFPGKSVGVFYLTGDAYSEGIKNNFVSAFGEDNIVTMQTFNENDSDFTTQINALKDCELIFMPIYYTPASNFMVQAKGKVANDAIYFGCDGFDGIDSAEGFDITDIPQQVSMLSHFNSKATEGAAKDYVDKYTENFGTDTLNMFGAAAYDCVYAIFNALKAAKAAGATVNGSVSASDMCNMLMAQFNGDFTFSGVTGNDIKWEDTGYVNKDAVVYIIKNAD